MGYYTSFWGTIDYSDVSSEKQEIIEKVWDVIELMQWGCTSRFRSGVSTNFYNEENRWLHFLYSTSIDKDKKKLKFSGEAKDYYDATATFLKLIAPYLNQEREFIVEFNGEDEFYNEEGEEIDPTPNQISVKEGQVFINGELFETSNKLSFPFPTYVRKFY